MITRTRERSRRGAGLLRRGNAKEQLRPGAAGQVAAQRVADAREWAGPRLGQAAESLQKSVEKDIAPRVQSATRTAAERSAPAREEARKRGKAAFDALRGNGPTVNRVRRWPAAMLFLLIGAALGAAGGLAARRAMGGSTESEEPFPPTGTEPAPSGDPTTSGGPNAG